VTLAPYGNVGTVPAVSIIYLGCQTAIQTFTTGNKQVSSHYHIWHECCTVCSDNQQFDGSDNKVEAGFHVKAQSFALQVQCRVQTSTKLHSQEAQWQVFKVLKSAAMQQHA